MKIVLNGRKVGNEDIAVYFENKAYFTKRGLTKRTVLHELYHHLAYSKQLDKPCRIEEKEANNYARDFLRALGRIDIYQLAMNMQLRLCRVNCLCLGYCEAPFDV